MLQEIVCGKLVYGLVLRPMVKEHGGATLTR